MRILCVSALLGGALLVGCTHHVAPGTVPEVSLDSVGQFNRRLSVELIHDQTDSAPFLMGQVGIHSYYVTPSQWTTFYIEQLASELAKRGAVVGNTSPHKMRVKLHNFRYVQGFAVVRAYITVELSCGAWTKTMVETDASGWSMGRAFGALITHSIERLLKNPEFIGQLED